jgi:hypothetical protein
MISSQKAQLSFFSFKVPLHDNSTEANQVCKLLACYFSEASSQEVLFTRGQVFHASSVTDFMLN